MELHYTWELVSIDGHGNCDVTKAIKSIDSVRNCMSMHLKADRYSTFEVFPVRADPCYGIIHARWNPKRNCLASKFTDVLGYKDIAVPVRFNRLAKGVFNGLDGLFHEEDA